MPFDQARADAATHCERKNCGQELKGWKTFLYNKAGDIKEIICPRCDNRDALDNYIKTGRISSRLSMFVTLYTHRNFKPAPHYDPPFADHEFFWIERANKALKAIESRVKEFEKKVWFGGGLQDFILKEKASGHSAEWGDFKVLTFCSAGRFLLTVEHKPSGDDITLITAEDEKPTKERPNGMMGYQGLSARPEMAEYLLEVLIYNWPEFKLKPNKEVSII